MATLRREFIPDGDYPFAPDDNNAFGFLAALLSRGIGGYSGRFAKILRNFCFADLIDWAARRRKND
ncbi:MAG: hypothetical protein LBO72_08070 [Helicobacteraceae bacterium]|jgi:hypothetical protein|nr:hypothetical protein [Helicobacteraceae bacterium]